MSMSLFVRDRFQTGRRSYLLVALAPLPLFVGKCCSEKKKERR